MDQILKINEVNALLQHRSLHTQAGLKILTILIYF